MLYDKIKSIYPALTDKEFDQYVILQNDSDGKGDYIREWKNSNQQPTQEQLDAITG
jgi:hypothetical protein